MREAELWARLDQHLGHAYALVWTEQFSLAELGNRTVRQALDDAIHCKTIWRAVWRALELPVSDR